MKVSGVKTDGITWISARINKARYGDAFYDVIREGSFRSASKVIPVLLSLIRPHSVVDVGCGSGTWLRVFQEKGVQDVFGIDGGKARRLEIPDESFREVNLAASFSLERRFDLAVCMEVAEHLPPGRARSFVRDLSGLAPAILFSAAVPGQGGTHHVNEQWPDYWAKIFSEFGYLAFDSLRPRLWNDDAIEWWYRQNMVLYLQPQVAAQSGLPVETSVVPLSLIHPGMLRKRPTRFRRYLDRVVHSLRPRSTIHN